MWALLDNFRAEPDRLIAIDRYAKLSDHYEDSTTRIRVVRRRVIDRLALTSGETVFDVACGAGAMLPELAACVGPLGHVIGIEQSPQMAALARGAAEGIGQIEIVASSVEGFCAPHRADALAFVYAHDVQQSPQALANVFAQARPGARVVVARAAAVAVVGTADQCLGRLGRAALPDDMARLAVSLGADPALVSRPAGRRAIPPWHELPRGERVANAIGCQQHSIARAGLSAMTSLPEFNVDRAGSCASAVNVRDARAPPHGRCRARSASD